MPIAVKLKICGLTCPDDIAAVNAAKPDFAGFVFAEGSRRRVNCDTARALSAALSPAITPVGVFVNQDVQFIVDLYQSGVIKIAQLHGGEGASYITDIKAAKVPVIQAIRAGHGDKPCELADYYLFDGAAAGSGQTFDYGLIPRVGKPWFIAGGINADNVENALRLNPFGVDVSSGVENNGNKDTTKCRFLAERVGIFGKR